MKIVTWNVNSIRARLERVEAWLESRDPDVVCVQETKAQESQFPAEAIRACGYQFLCRGQKTYNGVAILAKNPLEEIRREFADGGDEEQARFLDAKVSGIRFLCVYVPNGKVVGSESFTYKLEWLRRLRAYLDEHCDPTEPLVLTGDFNVAPDDRDVHDPSAWENEVLCHPDERAALRSLIDWGLNDAFRLHQEEGGFYSWWDYRQLGFPKNRGLRIDHVLITRPLVDACQKSWIDRDERKGKGASDHAPVFAEIDFPS